MISNSEWVLIDTVTTGFKAPVFVVEIAAQKMKGWESVGPAFRKLLNQNEDIPLEAARVHGYTREILERDGESATDAYAAFADYTRGLPVVAYNLRYDWDDVLIPEWGRLGIKPIGTRGFCALRLTQRLLDPVLAGNCKLQTLQQFYRLPEREPHSAMGDVKIVIDLLKDVLKPLADEQSLVTWADVLVFTEEEYFPSRIAFGKFKGRAFQDAVHDTELKNWLSWLSSSANERSSRMGTWYLERLELNPNAKMNKFRTRTSDNSYPENVVETERTSVKIYQDPEAKSLSLLIEAARSRLADLETTYAKEQRAVNNVGATIFNLTRELYLTRDRLKLKIQYWRLFLDTLLQGGEEEAEEIVDQYNKAAADNEEDYKNAAAAADKDNDLSHEQQIKLKATFIKLVKLFHPDRHAGDPKKGKVYEDLMTVSVIKSFETGLGSI